MVRARVRGMGVAVMTSRWVVPCAQGVALEHAEAVLLVDDGEAEVVEGDAFFDQGVGADDEVESPFCICSRIWRLRRRGRCR